MDNPSQGEEQNVQPVTSQPIKNQLLAPENTTGTREPTVPQSSYPPPQYSESCHPPQGYHTTGPLPPGYLPPGYQYPPGSGYSAPPNQVWMTIPTGIPNCPPGLEYLTQIDQLLVHQQLEIFEILTGFETSNRYVVKNSMGQKVYFAAEVSDFLMRNCCGPSRSFNMKIVDNAKNIVINLRRPLRCNACCYPCCLQTLEVSAPPGNVIGRIEQEWSIIHPRFKIQNAAGDTVLRIVGPFCTWSCVATDVEFSVLSADKKERVGKISKQWGGVLREMVSDADNFGINFPMDLDVNIKATLLGALFLIDYMFFETTGENRRRRAHQLDTPGMT